MAKKLFTVITFRGPEVCFGLYHANSIEDAYEHWKDQLEGALLTELEIKHRMPYRRPYRSNKVSHIHFDPSKKWFDAKEYFVIMTREEFERRCREADEAYDRKQLEIENLVARTFPANRAYELNDLPTKLQQRIEVTDDECWRWTGERDQNGYGKLTHNKKRVGAHRYVFESLAGEIPKGLILRHRCDYPSCVNPAHLIPGTHKQNLDDMVDRGRSHWQREWRETEKWIAETVTTKEKYNIEALSKTVQNKIDVQNCGCWLWRGTINEMGYGEYIAGGTRYLAHKYVFQKLVARPPRGVIFSHECANRDCVNPAHLKAKSRRHQ